MPVISKILTKAEKNYAALERQQIHAERHAQAATRREVLKKEKEERLAAAEKRRETLKKEKLESKKIGQSNRRQSSRRRTRPFKGIRWRNEMGDNRTLENTDPYIPYRSPTPSPPPDGIRNSHAFNANSLSLSANRSSQPFDDKSLSLSAKPSLNINMSKTLNNRMIPIHQTHGNRPPPMTRSALLQGIRNKINTYKLKNVMHNSSKLKALLNKAKLSDLIEK
jgi:hypothetical protein